LGTTGEGKSKLLELLISQDINLFLKKPEQFNCAVCLLDPTNRGETMNAVLNHCIKAGFEKVCLIDLQDIFTSHSRPVPILNPIHYKAPVGAVIGNFMDCVRSVWGTDDWAKTAVIQKYLPAVIAALHCTGKPLYDSICLTAREEYSYIAARTNMLLSMRDDYPYSRHKIALKQIFSTKSQSVYQDFNTTARRLDPLFEEPLGYMLCRKEPAINFYDLVADNWLILVNLYRGQLYDEAQQKFLGSMIVNEIIRAVNRLRARQGNAPGEGWKGRCYLYVDEAGQFTTQTVRDILTYERKSGLILTLSHQMFSQFKVDDVRSAVEGLTKIKVLFNVPRPEDADRMTRMMYGGAIRPEDASYVARQLKRQYAIIKNNKRPPVSMRVLDVRTPKYPQNVIFSFKEKIYTSNPWYISLKDAKGEINNRFASTEGQKFRKGNNLVATQTGSTPMAGSGKGDDSQPGGAPGSAGRQGESGSGPDHTDSGKSAGTDPGIQVRSDVRPDFTDVQTTRKRRGSRKEQGDQPEGGQG